MNIQLANSITSTKKASTQLATYFIDMINGGTEDPVMTMVKIKIIEDALDTAKKDKSVREYVLQEAEKNGKSFEVMGARIDIAENGTKYDYSVCNDITWSDLNGQIENLKEQLKERETMLKVLPENGLADPGTGEMIYRPAKSSTRGIKITLK
jgi:hypothetical protein